MKKNIDDNLYINYILNELKRNEIKMILQKIVFTVFKDLFILFFIIIIIQFLTLIISLVNIFFIFKK